MPLRATKAIDRVPFGTIAEPDCMEGHDDVIRSLALPDSAIVPNWDTHAQQLRVGRFDVLRMRPLLPVSALCRREVGHVGYHVANPTLPGQVRRYWNSLLL